MNTVFRVEHKQNNAGLWYREDGIYDGFCEKLSDEFLRTLPMGFDPDMVRDNLAWISGADSMEQMRLWVSPTAQKELLQAGYEMFEVHAEMVRNVPNHVVFQRTSETHRIDRTDWLRNLYVS